jgi:filamin
VAENTYAEGHGITQGGSHVNKAAAFAIITRDSKGEPLTHGGDIFVARVIRATDGVEIPVEIDDNQDGTYTGVYHPTTSGGHDVEIFLRDKPIYGSPYSTVVYCMIASALSFISC